MGYIDIPRGREDREGSRGHWPFIPSTMAELSQYMIVRDVEISKARAKDPVVIVPDYSS